MSPTTGRSTPPSTEPSSASAVSTWSCCNAGTFPPSMPIDTLSSDEWRRVMAVNVDANVSVLRARSPRCSSSRRAAGGWS